MGLDKMGLDEMGINQLDDSDIRFPGREFLSDAPFFGLSLWTEFKLANCACASGWSCLMNLDLHLPFLYLVVSSPDPTYKREGLVTSG